MIPVNPDTDTDTDTDLPLLARRDAAPDLGAMYRCLLARWLAAPPAEGEAPRTQAGLADRLKVNRQQITNWKAEGGASARSPSWWVILWLAHATKSDILIRPSGVAIVDAGEAG